LPISFVRRARRRARMREMKRREAVAKTAVLCAF
jgi:hypothetical protein